MMFSTIACDTGCVYVSCTKHTTQCLCNDTHVSVIFVCLRLIINEQSLNNQ